MTNTRTLTDDSDVDMLSGRDSPSELEEDKEDRGKGGPSHRRWAFVRARYSCMYTGSLVRQIGKRGS